MTTNNPPILLNEAFPDWYDGKGIFSEMENVPWADTIDAELLDIDYFGNQSGMKKCSPLVYRMLEVSDPLSDALRKKLADLVVSKFKPNWDALWRTYHFEYNPIDDYALEERGTSSSEGEYAKNINHQRSGSTSDTETMTHGETVADSLETSRSEAGTFRKTNETTSSETNTEDETTSLTYGQNISENESLNSEKNQSKFGFNSDEEVPTDKENTAATNTKTTAHTGTDSTARDLDATKSVESDSTDSGSDSKQITGEDVRSITHGGTDERKSTVTDSETAADTHSGSDSDSAEYEKHWSGFRGNFTRQQLIEQERNLWLEDFFTRVYADVDTVIASMIYNRTHPVNPYWFIPFGYSNI